jgi:drug/metabolite transporter (DMT)-like permease
MTPIATLIWILNLVFDSIGQLSFKAAAVEGNQDDLLAHWQSLLRNKWLWLGLLAYGIDIVIWLAFLSMVPLSMAILVGSLAVFCVMIGGRVFFGEKITRRRLMAVSLVALGVALVGWGA